MKLAIACFVLLAVFASGFFLGRRFPAHRYEMAMSTNPYFVLDTTTGRVCDDRGGASVSQASDPFAKFGGHAETQGSSLGASSKNPIDAALSKGKTGDAASSNSLDAYFDKLRKQTSGNQNGLPYCGK